jgi:hypothetical protein
MKYSAFVFSIWIYAAWFGCVFCARRGLELESLFFPLVTWIATWFLFRPPTRDITKLLILCAFGLAFDTAIYLLSGIRYAQSPLLGVPIWMVALWFTFVPSLLPLSMALKGHYVLAAIIGAVFGPLSYKAGEVFGVLYMQNIFVIGIYAVFWALFFSFGIFWLRRKDYQNANS